MVKAQPLDGISGIERKVDVGGTLPLVSSYLQPFIGSAGLA